MRKPVTIGNSQGDDAAPFTDGRPAPTVSLEFDESDGSLWVGGVKAAGGSSSPTDPATPDTSVQFNDGGAFGGDAGFTWDKILQRLSVSSGVNLPNVAGVVIDAQSLLNSGTVTATGLDVSGTVNSTITSIQAVGVLAKAINNGTGQVNDLFAFLVDGNQLGGGGSALRNTGLFVVNMSGLATSNHAILISNQGTGANDYAISVDGGQSVIPSIATGNSANRDLAGILTLILGTKTQASTYLYVSPRVCVASSTAGTPIAVQVTNAVAATGAIKTTTLNAAGTGYAVDDVGTIDGGTGGTYRVLTLAGSGVATYLITAPGTAGYAVANAVTTTAVPAGGTGFKINITVIAGIDTLTLTVPGGANTDTYNYICVGRD